VKIFNETVTASLDAAGTATLTTDSYDLRHCAGYSIHAKWTKTGGTLGGTCKTQKSNDQIEWIDVTSQSISDASGTKEFEVPDVFYGYVRAVTNLTGGTADVKIVYNTKGI